MFSKLTFPFVRFSSEWIPTLLGLQGPCSPRSLLTRVPASVRIPVPEEEEEREDEEQQAEGHRGPDEDTQVPREAWGTRDVCVSQRCRLTEHRLCADSCWGLCLHLQPIPPVLQARKLRHRDGDPGPGDPAWTGQSRDWNQGRGRPESSLSGPPGGHQLLLWGPLT